MPNYFHPSDIARYVTPENNNNFIDNFALKYNLFLNFEKEGGKYKVKYPKKMNMPAAGQKMIETLKKRQEAQLKFLSNIYDFKKIEAEPDWRLVVGLGSEHVQETSMTFHHIYGIPYIPGSAIKGALHHLAKENKDKHELEIFGFSSEKNNEQKGEKGKVIFMDAFPVSDVKFAVDIMNPHYSEYYNNETYPGDWQNPVPINFLTIEKTKFRFIFLSEKDDSDCKEKKSDCLQKIIKWLKEVLEYRGIGAKTAVGYGYFKNHREK